MKTKSIMLRLKPSEVKAVEELMVFTRNNTMSGAITQALTEYKSLKECLDDANRRNRELEYKNSQIREKVYKFQEALGSLANI